MLKIYAIAFLLVCSIAPASGEVITEDFGGKIGVYMEHAQRLQMSGEMLRIEGPCLSACTILVAKQLPGRVCVTTKAELGFHAAWDYGTDGSHVVNPDATALLKSIYTPRLRLWIAKHGGLRPQMIFLKGKALLRMFPLCDSPAAYANY